MNLVATFRDCVSALVHPVARADALTAARHRAFIAPRIILGAGATAALPLYLVVRGVPSTVELVAFAFLIVPLVCAYVVSTTGRFELAHVLSASALAAIVVAVAWMTGGVSSPAAMLLALVPLEAALANSRRTACITVGIAAAALALLIVLDLTGTASRHMSMAGTTLATGIVGCALVFAAVLSFGSQQLFGLGAQLRTAEEERYRLLASNMTDVITRHGAKGVATFVSPAAERVLGLPPQELTGLGLFDRVHVADRPAYLTALAEAAAGQSRSVEFRIRRGGGVAERRPHFIWIEMRCRALPHGRADGEAACDVVAIMREVTERKLHEEEVARLHTHAEEANAAKSRFLATMSHELRTPLNAVIGFSEMLLHEAAMNLDAERRLEYARLIHESGHHLLSVVNLVLDMSKIESGHFIITPEPFAPAAVIRSSCDLLTLKAREAGLDIVLDLPAALPEINADKRALKQILLNLLSNAVKFTERGGQVTVSASLEDGMLAVSVQDTGIGIAADDLPRVGDPFFQARSSYDRPYEGTGLGLSIVKGLVSLHGGAFVIESEPDKGTRVTVRLPVDCEKKRKETQVVTLPRPDASPKLVPPEKPTWGGEAKKRA
ncbi:MAG: two-component system, cell cycle sensor histidine kinase DivJ [Variibacter sp.]|nr:two-component system, cell cycle sensor histidine kinase DivJ [Variibacter sp.]